MAARRAATWSGLKLVRRHARLSRASISHESSSEVICAYVERIWRTPYDDAVLVMPGTRNLKPGGTAVRLGRFEPG